MRRARHFAWTAPLGILLITAMTPALEAQAIKIRDGQIIGLPSFLTKEEPTEVTPLAEPNPRIILLDPARIALLYPKPRTEAKRLSLKFDLGIACGRAVELNLKALGEYYRFPLEITLPTVLDGCFAAGTDAAALAGASASGWEPPGVEEELARTLGPLLYLKALEKEAREYTSIIDSLAKRYAGVRDHLQSGGRFPKIAEVAGSIWFLEACNWDANTDRPRTMDEFWAARQRALEDKEIEPFVVGSLITSFETSDWKVIPPTPACPASKGTWPWPRVINGLEGKGPRILLEVDAFLVYGPAAQRRKMDDEPLRWLSAIEETLNKLRTEKEAVQAIDGLAAPRKAALLQTLENAKTAATAELAALQTQAATLQTDLADARSRLKGPQNRRSEIRQLAANAEMAVATAQSGLAANRSRIEELRMRQESLLDEREAKRERLAMLRSSLGKARTVCGNDLSKQCTFEGKTDTTGAILNGFLDQINTELAALNDLTADLRQLAAQLAKLLEEKSRLTLEIKSGEELLESTRSGPLAAEIAGLNAAIAEQEGRVAELERSLKGLEDQGRPAREKLSAIDQYLES